MKKTIERWRALISINIWNIIHFWSWYHVTSFTLLQCGFPALNCGFRVSFDDVGSEVPQLERGPRPDSSAAPRREHTRKIPQRDRRTISRRYIRWAEVRALVLLAGEHTNAAEKLLLQTCTGQTTADQPADPTAVRCTSANRRLSGSQLIWNCDLNLILRFVNSAREKLIRERQLK